MKVDASGRRWWPTSARPHTVRASRRRWPRSSPTTSASRTTTSPSVQADSQSTPYGPGTGGSRTAVVAGGAACEATVAVREQGPDRGRAHDGSRARRPRDRRERRVGARDAIEVGDDARRRQGRQCSTRHELPAEIGSGLEATVRFRPTSGSPRGRTRTHVCVVEVDGETWLPACCGTSCPRTAGR